MINFRSMLVSMAATFAASLPCQEPEPVEKPKLEQKTKAAEAGKDAKVLIEQLGSDSYRSRLDAERGLRQLGEAARGDLEAAAASAEDAEVQWRARRLLRQIGKPGGEGGLVQRDRQATAPEVADDVETDKPARRRAVKSWGNDLGTDPDAMRRQFESLFEQFERNHGLDIPRARFFDDTFFQDLQQQLGKGAARSQGMSMQIGPDGAVKVEVQEKGDDGKLQTKTYEAPDLETFHKNHPGVLQQNRAGLGLLPGNTLRGFAPLRGFLLDGTGRQWQPQNLPPVGEDSPFVGIDPVTPEAAVPPPAGKRLGISIRDAIAPEVRAYLELEDGVGLQVETVSEGSLAEALGLNRGDIVTKVAGKPVGSPQDVQAALGPIEQGAEVEVHFVRKGAERSAKAKKTEANEPAAEPASPESKPSKLEKRKGGSTIR